MVAWAILREARRRGGLSQRSLARLAGKAQSEISRIERGRQEPSLATLRELVRAAGFGLRIHLEPYDDHDEVLITRMLALTPAERLASLEEQSRFFADARLLEP